MTTPVSRRGFLKRGAVVGVSVPAFASLLAACGGSSTSATATKSAPVGTATTGAIPTTGSSGGGATATKASGASPTTNSGAGSPTTAATTAATAATSPTSSTGSETPIKGGTLVVQGHQEISSLHPDDDGPGVHYVIVRNINEPLVDLDYDYQVVPVLAEKYEAATDGMKYTFNLQKNVKYHDGSSMSAADVKFNFEWYKDPASAAIHGTDFAEIGTVDAPDDNTVVVNMSKINAAFLSLTASEMLIVPKAVLAKGKDTYSTAAIGTGPYKVKEWKAAEQTTLEAFDDYWGGRANIDVYREEIVPEGSVRAIALRTGKSDNAYWPLQAEDNLKFISEDKFDVNRTAGTAVNHFPLTNEKPALADKIVRQAMITAIDRDSLINNLEKGLAVKATANLSPAVVFYYNPDVKKYEYDPAAAMKLLEDAGYKAGSDGIREKGGVKLSFTVSIITGDQRRRPEAEVVQQNLKAVGIDMQIEEKPVATILDGLPKGDLDASLFNWTYGVSEPDARATLRSDAAQNFSHYKNPAMDKLLDQGVETIDPNARQKIYQQIQAMIAEDVPFIYVMFWEDIEIFNRRVRGRPEHANNSTYLYANIHKFWIDDSKKSV